MTQMTMGGNIPIAAGSVRATLRWTAGPGVPDVDASALLVEQNGEVGSDADFVFYNQPRHYTGSVRLTGKTSGPQTAESIEVDLAAVPGDVAKIVLAASADGGTFGQVPGLQLALDDLATGQPLAVFPMQAAAETAFVCAEIYRRDTTWKFRAVGQGYSSGLAGLASDFGIDVGHAEPADAPAASEPPTPTPPSPPTPPAPPTPPTPPTPPMPPEPPAPPAAPAPPPAAPMPVFGLDLGGAGGAGLFLPVSDDVQIVNDLGPEFSPVPAPLPAMPAPPQPPVPPPPLPTFQAPPAVAAPPQAPPPQAPPPQAPPPQAPPPQAPPSQASPPPQAPPSQASPPPQAAPTGVSLQKNDRIELTHSGPGPLNRVVFNLGWTPTEGRGDVDLDASVIAFDANAEKLAIVWYMHTNEFYGALQHTGDNRKGGGPAAEQILIELTRMPPNVMSLVFTINSFRKQTFTDIANAYCAVVDGDTGEPLVRFDLTDTQPSTALLMAELRRSDQPGMWRMRAIGEFHDYRTVKKLVPAAARQVTLGAR